jgi:hypothetical protein
MSSRSLFNFVGFIAAMASGVESSWSIFAILAGSMSWARAVCSFSIADGLVGALSTCGDVIRATILSKLDLFNVPISGLVKSSSIFIWAYTSVTEFFKRQSISTR